jgi:hypothetical protein
MVFPKVIVITVTTGIASVHEIDQILYLSNLYSRDVNFYYCQEPRFIHSGLLHYMMTHVLIDEMIFTISCAQSRVETPSRCALLQYTPLLAAD